MNPFINRKMLAALFVVCITACNNQPNTAASTVAEPKYSGPTNKDVYAVFNSGDWSKLDSLVAKDGVDHTPMGDVRGLDSLKASFKEMKLAFPDLKFEAMEEAIQGDMIFTRYHFTATNTGPFNGMPATNKKIDMIGVDVAKVKDGKLYEHWDYSDNLQFFKQLGIDPLAKPSKK
jgi:steroid delta-isomerase-like uncharacterized protein